jgi:hypothetical protein
MLRQDFQMLARLRLSEARELLAANHYAGAYHFAGAAVECALKACIARKTLRYEFPNRDFARNCYDHDPVRLSVLAGLQPTIDIECQSNRSFRKNWSVVISWRIDSRYDHAISRAYATDMYRAVAARQHGVMRWLRQRW